MRMFGHKWEQRYWESEKSNARLIGKVHDAESTLKSTYIGLRSDVLREHAVFYRQTGIVPTPDSSCEMPELRADGVLLMPVELRIELLEFFENVDSGTRNRVVVAKATYQQWQGFAHKIFAGDRTRALALIGRDETGQLWQHFLPDEFMTKCIAECERYLFQANPFDEIIEA